MGLTLILALFLATPIAGHAQGDVDTIERLEVRLWPDFDRPSVLVTLVGTLPQGTPDTAAVTVPVPNNATIHVVSPIIEDGRPGPEMNYDDSVPGQLTFDTGSFGFWVEYYHPYEADGNEREFSYTWLSEMGVDELQAVVQQPIMSSDLNTNPGAETVTTGPDGMQYHQLQGRPVPAGAAYTLEGTYSLVRPQLSQDVMAEQQGSLPSITESGAADDSGVDWLLVAAIAAGVVAVVVAAWLLIANRRGNQRVVKPRPSSRSTRRTTVRPRPSPPASTKGKFCRECGQPVEPGDRFCSNCGTVVK